MTVQILAILALCGVAFMLLSHDARMALRVRMRRTVYAERRHVIRYIVRVDEHGKPIRMRRKIRICTIPAAHIARVMDMVEDAGLKMDGQGA